MIINDTIFQNYTGINVQLKFSLAKLYDIAVSYLTSYCSCIAKLLENISIDENGNITTTDGSTLTPDELIELGWLQKAIMLQIEYTNNNYDYINSVQNTTGFSIGDYSESYSYNYAHRDITPYDIQALSMIDNNISCCQPWWTRQGCGCCNAGPSGGTLW